MKQLFIMALALVASASSFAQLRTSSDSVSYAAGVYVTNGLVPFLVQQHQVDTAYMADFVRGFREVVSTSDDPVSLRSSRTLPTRLSPAVSTMVSLQLSCRTPPLSPLLLPKSISSPSVRPTRQPARSASTVPTVPQAVSSSLPTPRRRVSSPCPAVCSIRCS